MALYLPPQGVSTLTPLTQLCPGLHGDGDARTRSVPWRALLCDAGRYEVPIFQRPYCWPAHLAEAWYDDAVAGAAHGSKDVGTVVTRARVVIDGQQRLTTSLLMVAALRDAGEGLRGAAPPGSGEEFVLYVFLDECRSILFVGDAPRPMTEGDCWAAARLEPSFFDRRAFHGVLAGAAEESDSLLLKAKTALDGRVAREVKRWRSGGCGAQLQRLKALLGAALDGLVVTSVDVVAPHALDSQLFLFVQERSLLDDDAGGVKPRTIDLVRNLLAAAFADLGPDKQDEVFRELWLEPLERHCRDFDGLLADFVGGGGDDRFVSEFEKAIDRRRVATGADGGLAVYARVVSKLAAVEAELRGGPEGAGALVQMTSLADGTLTPAPTAANYARGGGAVLRFAAVRVLGDLAAFASCR